MHTTTTVTAPSRVRRATAPAVALAAAAVVLTACGRDAGSTGPSPTANTANPTSSANPGPTGTAGTPSSSASPSYAPITIHQQSDAAKTFGAANAKRGVAAAYRLVQTAAGMDQALASGRKSSRDYEPVRSPLTPTLWHQVAQAADAGDPDGISNALVLTADASGRIAVDAHGGEMAHPTLVGLTLGGWTASVDRQPGTTRLAVQTSADITYQGAVGGKPTTVTLHRAWSLTLIPTGKTTWLVDAYQTETTPVA